MIYLALKFLTSPTDHKIPKIFATNQFGYNFKLRSLINPVVEGGDC